MAPRTHIPDVLFIIAEKGKPAPTAASGASLSGGLCAIDESEAQGGLQSVPKYRCSCADE